MALAQRVKKLEDKLIDQAESIDPELTEDDQDCLDIVEVCRNTLATTSPNYRDIEETAAYKRGWELRQKLYPIIPVHLDPLNGKRCEGFFDFLELHKRRPSDGDVLRYSELAEEFDTNVLGCLYNQLLAEAWHRKITHLPYPLKWANELLYLRQYDHRTGATTWEEHYSQPHPQHRWRLIEKEVGTEKGVIASSRMPITPAVVFRIDGQGYYKVRPYNADGKDQYEHSSTS